MAVQNVVIDKLFSVIFLDSVTFPINFSEASVSCRKAGEYIFMMGTIRAALKKEDADRLVAAGVRDCR